MIEKKSFNKVIDKYGFATLFRKLQMLIRSQKLFKSCKLSNFKGSHILFEAFLHSIRHPLNKLVLTIASRKRGLNFKILFLIVMFITNHEVQQAFAQQKDVDSLLVVLKTAKADTVRVKTLYFLSDEFYQKEPDKSIDFADEGITLSKQIGFKTGICFCLTAKGFAYNQKAKFDSALICFEEGMKISREINDSSSIAAAYDNISIVDIHFGDIEKALKYRKQANEIYKILKDSTSLASGYNWIGNIYKEQGEYELALEYYFKAIGMFRKGTDDNYLRFPLLNISSVFRYLKQYEKAKEFASDALRLSIKSEKSEDVAMCMYRLAIIFSLENKMDSSINYLKEALIILNDSPNPYFKHLISLELGRINLHLGKTTTAINDFNVALAAAQQIGDKSLIMAVFQNIGGAYFDKNDYQKSLDYIRKSYKLSSEINDRKALLELSKNLVEIFARVNEPDSLMKYFIMYQQLSDTLFNQQKMNSIAEMQTKYDTEKKDIQIALLNLENSLKDQQTKQAKMERNLLFICIILVILAGFSFFYFWRKRKEIINERKVNEIKSKVERIKINPHFLKNTLSFIDDFYVRNNDIGNASKYLNKLQQLMICILEDSDHELISLEKEIETLKLYINLLNLGSRNLIDWTIECEPEIDTEQILVPPTIIQPLVENSFKHAFKGIDNPKLEVKFSLKDEMLSCLVIDNGKGWDGSKDNTKNQKVGIGIPITTGRIDIYSKQKKRKGQLIIEELKDVFQKCVGTKIEIVLPVSFAF